jgi:hypothetical protein
MPRDSRIAPRLAAAIPFPKEETTPPVTNTYLVMERLLIIADGSLFYFKAMYLTIEVFRLLREEKGFQRF